MIPIFDSVLDIGSKLIDKFIPDPVEKMKAQASLLQMQQNGELKELETRMSAIIAEANSKDPWTSRARPSFMYVIYICILAGIPMGVLHAFRPELTVAIAAGFKAWLEAIPDQLYYLFGIGYVGYSAARTVDKGRGK